MVRKGYVSLLLLPLLWTERNCHCLLYSKAKTGGKIEKSLDAISPVGIVCGVQEKTWIDTTMMNLWYRKVWKPYVSNANSESALLLDDYVCHKTDKLGRQLSDVNTTRIIKPPNFLSCVQSYDVGINKFMKDRLKKIATNWRRTQHALLIPGGLIPTPKRKDILEWLKKIWDEFSTEIVQNSFIGSGYVYENNVHYSGATVRPRYKPHPTFVLPRYLSMSCIS